MAVVDCAKASGLLTIARTKASISSRRMSVLGRMFNVIDYQHGGFALLGFELQPKLLVKRREDRRTVRIDRRKPFAVEGGLQKSLRRPCEIPVENAGEPRLVHHAA